MMSPRTSCKLHSCVLVLLLAATPVRAEQVDSPPLLAEPDWVATELVAQNIDRHADQSSSDEREAQKLLLLDIRSDEQTRRVKPPGAITIDASEWKQAFNDGTDVDGWTARIGGVLKNKDATVVVFDQQFTPTATRIWWILKYWGVNDVRVLNGGFQAYLDAGGLIVAGERGPNDDPSNFLAVAHPERLASYEQVRAIANEDAGATCLIDTRSDGEVAAGKIPTSKHLDWQALVDRETGKLRPQDELESLLDGVGYQPDTPAVTYCRSGGRASAVAFAMELVGGKPASNYHGSWNEWSKKERARDEVQAIGQ